MRYSLFVDLLLVFYLLIPVKEVKFGIRERKKRMQTLMLSEKLQEWRKSVSPSETYPAEPW
ncbi:MAG: hypothetical protein JO327_08135 [Nitrososphaeraceae archaeon]|nr:hypothetical protein [Nitrososphaeraceae archaeon]